MPIPRQVKPNDVIEVRLTPRFPAMPIKSAKLVRRMIESSSNSEYLSTETPNKISSATREALQTEAVQSATSSVLDTVSSAITNTAKSASDILWRSTAKPFEVAVNSLKADEVKQTGSVLDTVSSAITNTAKSASDILWRSTAKPFEVAVNSLKADEVKQTGSVLDTVSSAITNTAKSASDILWRSTAKPFEVAVNSLKADEVKQTSSVLDTVSSAITNTTKSASDILFSGKGMSSSVRPLGTNSTVAQIPDLANPFQDHQNTNNTSIIAGASSLERIHLLGLLVLVVIPLLCVAACCARCCIRKRRVRHPMEINAERGLLSSTATTERIILPIRGAGIDPDLEAGEHLSKEHDRDVLSEGKVSEDSEYARSTLGTLPRPALSRRASKRLSKLNRALTERSGTLSRAPNKADNAGGDVISNESNVFKLDIVKVEEGKEGNPAHLVGFMR